MYIKIHKNNTDLEIRIMADCVTVTYSIRQTETEVFAHSSLLKRSNSITLSQDNLYKAASTDSEFLCFD